MSVRFSNTTSDYIQWNEMVNLVRKLYDDRNYNMSLLIAMGSFTGLRISDLLSLTWDQVLNQEMLEVVEIKTKKRRIIKLNNQLQKHILTCHQKINPTQSKCFISQMGTVFSIQRINVIFKEIKQKYGLNVPHFSTHSMRKCFGRAVFEKSGTQSELALIKLSELFNHSSPSITRRYLGLKHDEMMQTYDCLTF